MNFKIANKVLFMGLLIQLASAGAAWAVNCEGIPENTVKTINDVGSGETFNKGPAGTGTGGSGCPEGSKPNADNTACIKN